MLKAQMARITVIATLISLAWAVSVCIDPGHGGTDSGASGTYYLEKNANLDVAKMDSAYLANAGSPIAVYMTRHTDITVSLADRCSYANSIGVDRFMSHHENAYNTDVQGTETYCHPSGSPQSFDLRDRVHPWLIWAHNYYDRGTKTADYYVLRNTTMPAILGEGTFIDYDLDWNESYRYYTWWNDHQGRQGYAYCRGFCEHMGITPPVYGSLGSDTDTLIVDNGDPEYTEGGTWISGTYSGGWAGDYRYCNVGGSLDWVHWTPNLPRRGIYDVYMWWLAGSNRCTNVFVRIYGLVDDTMYVNQQGSGSEWHYLGRRAFDSGNTGYVGLNDVGATGGSVVIADAVKWVYLAPFNSIDTIIVDDKDFGYSETGTWADGSLIGGWSGDYRYASVGTETRTAKWTPFLPRRGYYDVYMWWVAGTNRCDCVKVRIAGTGDDTVVINQKLYGSQWNYLGRYEFPRSQVGYVQISNSGATGGDVIIADAVMFVYSTPLAVDEDRLAPAKTNIEIYPSPFNSSCIISAPAGAEIEIYDVNGRLVWSSPIYESSENYARQDDLSHRKIIWTPDKSVKNGIYLVKARIGEQATTKRAVLMR